jgi:hypothetical protein
MKYPDSRHELLPQAPRREGLSRIGMFTIAHGVLLLLCWPFVLLAGQETPSGSRRDTLLLPEANRPPDANARMKMRNAKQASNNFDAANALRQKQINDETIKLLILAKDLKTQIDQLGDNPLTDRMLREAEVIELLAHDVQTKMTLTVKGG